MAVTTPKETWTAPRLDELNKRVNVGFEKGEADIRSVRGEMKAGFEKVDERFEKVDERFEKVDEKMDAGFREIRSEVKAGFDKFDKKFDRLTYGLLAAAVAIVATLLGVNLG